MFLRLEQFTKIFRTHSIKPNFKRTQKIADDFVDVMLQNEDTVLNIPCKTEINEIYDVVCCECRWCDNSGHDMTLTTVKKVTTVKTTAM